MSMSQFTPLARTHGLLCEIVGDETVVFDRKSQKAYRLNPSATIIWRHCDGKTSVEELARILERELKLTEPAEPLVEMALQKIESLGLLEGASGVTRRQMGRKIAVAAALIPAVAALTVPTPARAASGCTYIFSPPSEENESDLRLKKNIRIIGNAVENIEKLHGVTYDWRMPDEREIGQDVVLPTGEPQIGVIAQEVEQVFPQAVVTGADGVKRVNYGGLIGPLIEAVKAQQREIAAQNERIERQQRDIDDLKRALSCMEDEHSLAIARR
jgi:endosialidase-like protein/coenzyme PQQ synthesis protein D (PqqD)